MKTRIQLALWYAAARIAGALRPKWRRPPTCEPRAAESGISVIIPSRNGKALLEAQLPGIARELESFAAEIIVADNGSGDGTAQWLRAAWPQVQIELSNAPLSFARAVNRAIARARYSHLCLLNNDMLLEPGFFAALVRAFAQVPDLFCATAQIRFPEGVRREETGKTVMAQSHPEDFPIRCDEPLPGEDLSYVLYGSGGCSLYDAAKLRELGGVDEAYEPAYVEDLDLGYRAWQRGWPSVYVAGAVVEHRHRATTSRYYTAEQLEEILEVNYLKFLTRAVASPRLFRRLWRQATRRLRIKADRGPGTGGAPSLLRIAARIALGGGLSGLAEGSEESILALTSGAVAVFPGQAISGRPRALVVSPYLESPLSDGRWFQMYNMMRRVEADFDPVLITFTKRLATPPPEILAICAEVVLVVEDSPSPAFRAALRQTVRKWRPAVAQLEVTQMAHYAADCAPARTTLMEWDTS
ncbi:MAG: glycosyltransferase family 2 protein [Bryobacteraceae bacterium]